MHFREFAFLAWNRANEGKVLRKAHFGYEDRSVQAPPTFSQYTEYMIHGLPTYPFRHSHYARATRDQMRSVHDMKNILREMVKSVLDCFKCRPEEVTVYYKGGGEGKMFGKAGIFDEFPDIKLLDLERWGCRTMSELENRYQAESCGNHGGLDKQNEKIRRWTAQLGPNTTESIYTLPT